MKHERRLPFLVFVVMAAVGLGIWFYWNVFAGANTLLEQAQNAPNPVLGQVYLGQYEREIIRAGAEDYDINCVKRTIKLFADAQTASPDQGTVLYASALHEARGLADFSRHEGVNLKLFSWFFGFFGLLGVAIILGQELRDWLKGHDRAPREADGGASARRPRTSVQDISGGDPYAGGSRAAADTASCGV